MDRVLDVESLTVVAQDYLKVLWSATEWGGAPITTKALAARFATTAANVSVTLRRLQAQGLVVYQPYRPAELTELGCGLAVSMVRRHRLVETFLARVLGYGWDEVHDEAERLEHAVSDDFLARIDALLDHPRFDPHGDPIPAADGSFFVPETVELGSAPAGTYLVARVSDDDPAALAEFAGAGLVPGALVEVDADGGIRVGVVEVSVAPGRLASVRVLGRG